MISIYLQGLSLGLAYVAPIGMQNLFVINSAMSQKLRCATATALIVIFWDISLGIACFLGAGALMEAFRGYRKLFSVWVRCLLFTSAPGLSAQNRT